MNKDSSLSDSYNFGPEFDSNRSVQEVVDAFSKVKENTIYQVN